MDAQSISTCPENQATSLTSIHIHDSYTHNSSSIPPENLSHDNVFVTWVVTPLLGLVHWIPPALNELQSHDNIFVRWVLSPLLRLLLWLLKKIFKCFGYYIILCIGMIVLGIVGTLSSITLPFLLVSLLVLRLSQFIKRGEDYNKVTQVKMVVEWFMVINIVLLAVGTLIIYSLSVDFFGLKKNMSFLGEPLRDRVKFMTSIMLSFPIFRFVLLSIIQAKMPRMILEHNEIGLKTIQATSDIVDALLVMFVFYPIMPGFSVMTAEWFDATLYVIIGCNIIALSTHFIVWSTHILVSRYLSCANDEERSKRYLLLERLLSVKYLVYYGNGIKRSFNFMLISLLLLLVWVLYCGPHLLKTNSKGKTVREFGSWTFTVLLILSILWVVKDFVLLSWEANAVYHRLSGKIIEASKSLYYLGVLGRHSDDILKLRYEVIKESISEDQSHQTKTNSMFRIFKNPTKNLVTVDQYYRGDMDEVDIDIDIDIDINEVDRQQVPMLSNIKRARVKSDLLMPKDEMIMTLFNIQQVSQYFLSAADLLSKETYTFDILKKLTLNDNRENLMKLIIGKNDTSDLDQSSTELTKKQKKSIESLLQDWENFKVLLKLDASSHVSHSDVKTWLETSHNKCLFLANTMCSAKEVVDCLNTIISVLLICASFIIWLIVTGLADTTVLVLIASPLLAATFIFGDTCKSLFQGIMFVYVVHPFDVGDLCVIDEKMMEVRSIGVWKTIFSNIEKVGTREEVIYPNSELAMKTFINHKTEFDWNDYVEFDVGDLDKQQISDLKKQIEELLDAQKDKSMPGSHSVSVISNGNDTKIGVRFRHNNANADMTYFECVKEKEKLRFTFVVDVQDIAKMERQNKN